MDAIKQFIIDMYNRIVNSRGCIQLMNFMKKYVTTTDYIMGGFFFGGFFIHPTLWGCHYLIPKVCSLYFIGKGSLVFMKEKYPSSYQNLLNSHSSMVNRICRAIIPSDYLNCYEVIKNLFQPYLSKFDDFTPISILTGIYKASATQKPIEITGDRVNSNQLEFLERACLYCEMATGIYGPTMVYGLMREVDEVSDIKHLLNGTKNKEGYKQAFLDHCHLKPEDLLYINWGCEDTVEQNVITTATGMEITSPPYFLIHHEATKSIVLCIRGTWNVKDFISDFKCEGISWGSGKAHEGIALIANSILKDDDLNHAIVEALKTYPDYQVVTVGHSLGAGIASLVTLNWRYNRLYNQPCCYAIAPPPILSSSVWDKGVGYIYSFVNEDDIVPRLSKNGISQMIQSIIGNCREKRNWFKKVGDSVSESMQSLFGKNNSLVQLYLPGTVYYMHPCMDHYTEYEETKRVMGNNELPLLKRVKTLHDKIEGHPGMCLFVKGSSFPVDIILSPMVLFHHFVFSYEEMIKNVYNVVKQEADKNNE